MFLWYKYTHTHCTFLSPLSSLLSPLFSLSLPFSHHPHFFISRPLKERKTHHTLPLEKIINFWKMKTNLHFRVENYLVWTWCIQSWALIPPSKLWNAITTVKVRLRYLLEVKFTLNSLYPPNQPTNFVEKSFLLSCFLSFLLSFFLSFFLFFISFLLSFFLSFFLSFSFLFEC